MNYVARILSFTGEQPETLYVGVKKIPLHGIPLPQINRWP